jgi:hypothetical protein
LPWDSDEELVTLTPEHLARMLERFLSGDLTSSDLDRRANAIEGRDDIGVPSPRPRVVHPRQRLLGAKTGSRCDGAG